VRSFVVRDIELGNPTRRIDVRQFDPGLLRTISIIREAARRNPERLKLMPLAALVKPDLGITGGATPKGGIYVEVGVPFIRVQNVRRGYLDLTEIVYIDDHTHREDLHRSALKLNDVLITITGATYGLVAKTTKKVVPGNVNQHVVRLRLKPEYDPDFLVGYLNSRLGRDQFEHAYTGSSRQALDYPALRQTKILLPSRRVMSDIGAGVRDGLARAERAHNRAFTLLSTEGQTVHKLLHLPALPPQKARTFVVDPSRISDRLDAIAQDPDHDAVVKTVKRGRYSAEPVESLARETTRKLTPSAEPEREFLLVELPDFDPDFGAIRPPTASLGIDIAGTRVALAPGEVAASRLRFYLRKVAVIPKMQNAITTTEVCTFACDRKIDAEYLWILLRQDFAIRQMQHTITGSSRPRSEGENILKVVVPIPPPAVRLRLIREVRGIYDTASKQKVIAERIRESAFDKVRRMVLGEGA